MAFITARIDQELKPPTPSPLLDDEPLILVVEDDWSTRRFICGVLKRATTAFVIEAASPTDALKLTRLVGHPTLLISDIGLHAPKTGVDLAGEIVADSPTTKVLLMSGGDSPIGDIPPDWRFLAKPFPLDVFLDCVHQLCRAARLA